MFNWISCTLGGFAILLALSTIAPADRASLADLAREQSVIGPAQVSVDRTNKSDRLVGEQRAAGGPCKIRRIAQEAGSKDAGWL